MTLGKTRDTAYDHRGADTVSEPERNGQVDPPVERAESRALWPGVLATSAATGLSFLLYWRTAAPDLTWAHHGADGGDLLAAAVSRGVPHPSGYPLYTMFLQGWLIAGRIFAADASPARLGNLLSAMLASATVAVTVLVAARLLGGGRRIWWLAASVGLLWAVSPLVWSQALITEVYALHALLAVLLAAAILVWPDRPLLIGVLIGLGLAHHLTFLLLLPAAFFLLWRVHGRELYSRRWASALGVGLLLAAAFYLRIPITAPARNGPPPVNWGYADNLQGFWWLVSGAAYRAYLGDVASGDMVRRAAASARSLTTQFTPLGLIVAAVGLAYWDRARPDLRTFALLWILPVSLYSVAYATRDAEVYLLPATWLMAVLVGVGAAALAGWVAQRSGPSRQDGITVAGVLLLAFAAGLAAVRAPQLSLHSDTEAIAWLDSVADEIEPGGIVVSSGDRQTFALWYGAWASGKLLEQAPDAVIVNDALYQFDWYPRLLGDLYPDVSGVDDSFEELLRLNVHARPIYFVEPLDSVSAADQEPAGSIWRYAP